MISAEVSLTVQFYDVDPMKVVWHGNYPKYLELARCALLERIGYTYDQMEASGYAWPIVDMRLKYVRPAVFGQALRVTATLKEYENRLRLEYRIRDALSGDVLTKAATTQLAVHITTQELCIVTPAALQDRVRALT